MQDRLVHLEIVDGIATITLDSPHNRNALSRQLVSELADAVERIDATSPAEARAVLLRHEGPAFCAGADLKERAADDGATASSGSTSMVDVMRWLMDVPRPTIAVVGGAVRAGGIGLMASCDLVVVHTAVSFAMTEVRIGVAPAIISVPILRRVSPARIAAAMLTGETFSAAEARDLGLVTHVTDDVDAQAERLCQGIRAGAPKAVAETKRLIHHVPTLDRDTAWTEMQELSEALFRSEDAREGMQAFRERRPPVWLE